MSFHFRSVKRWSYFFIVFIITKAIYLGDADASGETKTGGVGVGMNKHEFLWNVGD